jgi:glycosyltransferase involved in cell wall biosynthesis
MKVALVHDWLTGMRGGERVLQEIANLFPEAPIYTLIHRPGSVAPELESHPIHTSWLQHLSFGGRRWRYLLKFMPAAVESIAIPAADLVISTSHCVAKGVIPPRGAFHLSYVHTPMRYAWDQRASYLDHVSSPLRPLIQLQLARLRQWDVVSSARVDRLIANSSLVAWRIRHFWNRAADVMPPPVDTEFFTPGGERTRSLLTVAALVPYKRVEMAMEVAARLDRPLEVIGTGPLLGQLRRRAKGQVRFLGWQSPEDLRAAYRRASALLVPNVEDFGIVTVEALACGTPVVGLMGSGTQDVIRPGVEGQLAVDGSAEALTDATAEALSRDWDQSQLLDRARVFSRERFLTRFRFLIDRLGFGEALT